MVTVYRYIDNKTTLNCLFLQEMHISCVCGITHISSKTTLKFIFNKIKIKQTVRTATIWNSYLFLRSRSIRFERECMVNQKFEKFFFHFPGVHMRVRNLHTYWRSAVLFSQVFAIQNQWFLSYEKLTKIGA